MKFTSGLSDKAERVKEYLENAEAVVIGAGAGLSTAAGFTYSGKRFHENFHDFEVKYKFHDCIRAAFTRTKRPRNTGRTGRDIFR